MLRSRHQQREATRTAIVEAARVLFSERGFDETSTQVVAIAAGVAGGTVFVHFRDKGALLRAVVDGGAGAVVAAAVSVLPAVGVLRQLGSLGGSLFHYFGADRRLGRAWVQETLFDSLEDRPEGLLHRAAALIDSARIRGEIERAVDPRLGAATFLALTWAGLVAVLRDEVPPGQQTAVLEAQLGQYLRPVRRN